MATRWTNVHGDEANLALCVRQNIEVEGQSYHECNEQSKNEYDDVEDRYATVREVY